MSTTKTTTHRTRPGRPKGWRKGVVKHSKMIRQRGADTRSLTSSIEVFKADVAAGLGQRLASELAAGEVLPDFGLSLDLVGRTIERALERLQAAERRYIVQRVECAAVRRRSEQLARHEVYPRVVAVRRLIDSQLGKEAGRGVHGMVGKTLRKPRRLHGQLRYLVWALEDGRDELPAPLLASQSADRDVWLREIKPGYQRLTVLLDELGQLELCEQQARDEKNEALSAFDVEYGEALRLVQATFTFSGYGAPFAKKLRSYLKRRLLSRRAREKRQARAAGRVRRTLRCAASSVLGWVRRRPPSVA